ncbi:MAG: amidohydrolase/deacetylase family metallohydrolase [Daejeonella sp.]|uniref:amidohydrolase/deacetylase family metallohydrolase n=1 Tax=Daejeonella sp. JGW-45 TaxID=3034148 RepID=UPI0023ECC6A6|nr:amidohydrolase/deacetylase family metallohydrolase [Daejeonella sp. JGW-45]
MNRKQIFFFSVMLLWCSGLFAQQAGTVKPYNIVIKGGHIIDPKNNVDAVMDIAIKDGKIALIAKSIDGTQGTQVVNAKGMYVTPGLIDLHVHFFWGHDGSSYMNAPSSLPADGFTFPAGVTTVVDAGSPGWKNFELYKKQTIDRSQTRVLAMLNIVGQGMAGGQYESNIDEMEPQKTADMAKKYPEHVVGVKLAHFSGRGPLAHSWIPVDRAIEAGKLANIPIMVDFGSATPYLPLDSLFNVKFRPGDIYTHAFGGDPQVGLTIQNGRESIVDVSAKKVKQYAFTAQKRGVIFDVGFGGSSFLFSQGIPAIKSGFYPNSISTDLHTGSMNNAMKNMPNIMSLFMAMGMPFKEVIKASTWNPAQQIKRPELGNLSVGSEADIAIFTVRKGNFGFYARDGKIPGKERLETEMTIRAGRIVYNLNAIAEPNVIQAPPRPRNR